MNPSKYIEEFLAEMVELLPNSEYRKRGKCPVKEMCDAAVKRGFTNLLIFTEVTLTLALTLILAQALTLALALALALTRYCQHIPIRASRTVHQDECGSG